MPSDQARVKLEMEVLPHMLSLTSSTTVLYACLAHGPQNSFMSHLIEATTSI